MDFKSSIEETSEATRSISIEIPREIYDNKFNKLLNKAASNARLKGFRPGRAPKAHVAKLYGEQIHSDVMGDLVTEAYQNVVKDNELKVVGYPEFDIQDEDKEKDLTIKANIAIYPEPTLKDYTGISIEVEKQEVSDEELAKRIESICQQQATTEKIEDRTSAKNGDLAMVDYEATVEGVKVPGASGQNIQLELGKENRPDPVAEHVVGMEIGGEKIVEMMLADSFPEELRKSPATYTIKLNGLFTKNIPELSDEVAKNSGLAEDVEGLQTHIKNNLEKEVQTINKSRKEEAFIEAIFTKNTFEIPQALKDEEIRMMLFEFGILNPRDNQSYRADVSRFREMFNEKAEINAKRGVILSRLEAQENPTADESDVEAWLDAQAEVEQRTREEINQYYQFPQELERLQGHVARIKMIDGLLEQATIKEVPPTTDKEETKK